MKRVTVMAARVLLLCSGTVLRAAAFRAGAGKSEVAITPEKLPLEAAYIAA